MAYVDGFVAPVPRSKLSEYFRISRKAGRIWRKHGALEYRECAADDLRAPRMRPFGKTVDARRSETIVFAWIVFKSRRDRDRINARVMKDPAMLKMMESGQPMVFDFTRMAYGGFKVRVDL